jgi:hypothetical protein
MRKFLQVLLVVAMLFLGTIKVVHATSLINLNIKNNGVIIYSGTISLSSTSSEDNVLSVIKQADTLSPDFNISNIVHYSFGDYLKCITISGTTELCDSWLYKVNGDSPAMGMDSYTLSGDENILLYFGDDVAPAGNIMTGGGPLTTGYIPPPTQNPSTLTPTMSLYSPSIAPLLTVLPISLTLEPKSAVVPPPPTPSFFSHTTKAPEVIQETKNLALVPKPKTKEKNLSITGKGNTAAVINAIPKTVVQIPTEKKNWFARLLDNIFGGF